METWQTILGIAFGLFCLGVLVWKAAKYVRRGWKDHRWIWQDANRAALLVAIMMAGVICVDLLRHGFDFRVWITLSVALVFMIGPYMAYIAGRLFGIWHRSRSRQTLS